MRFTIAHYDKAIENLQAAKQQLEPDGRCCSICEDTGHQAFECGRNPLVAQELCRETVKQVKALEGNTRWLEKTSIVDGESTGPGHPLVELLDWIAGEYTCMGEVTGPSKVIPVTQEQDVRPPETHPPAGPAEASI